MSLLGTVVGDYKILKKIGAGGMGVVYEGIHVRLEQPVAIKDLSPDLASNEEMRARFIREAKIQARLNHPNVVNVHNLIEYKGRLLLVMEFVEGRTLDEIIQERGALPYTEAVRITRQVLDALAFMHSKGVIHRDLKPGNIMITSDGHVKVTDFGIAKATTEQGHTRAGVRLGTLWYMSPEQIRGKGVDARSDLYAMGVTLFQMVTGKLPFFGNSDYEIMKAHTETPPPDPKNIKKDIPKPLAVVILKFLEKDPAKRYQTAKEAARALDAWAQGAEKKPMPQKPPKPRKASISPKKKQLAIAASSLTGGKKVPTLVWIIVGILLFGACVIIFTYWMMNRKQSIIPVVKAPALERNAPVAAAVAPDETPENKKNSGDEDATPVIEEIEKEAGITGEKKKEPESPSSSAGEKNGSESPQPKMVEKKPEKKEPPPSQEISPGGSVVEMSPSGEIKKGKEEATEKPAKPKSKKSKAATHTKPRKKEKQPEKPTTSVVKKEQSEKSASTRKKKKNGNKKYTIDKRIGYFFKSLKKSMKDLEHPHGSNKTGKKSANPEGNNPSEGVEGAFEY